MKTLRLRLSVLFIVLLLVTVGAITWVTLARTEQALERQIVETHRAQAGAHAAAVGDLVAEARRDALETAASPILQTSPPYPQEDPRRTRLNETLATGPFVAALFITAGADDVVETPPGLVETLFADEDPRPFLQTIDAVGNSTRGAQVARWPTAGSWSVLAPVRGDNGRFHGTLLLQGAPVRPPPGTLLAESGSDGFVVDAQGTVIGGPEGTIGDDVRAQVEALLARHDRTAVVRFGGTDALATLFPLPDAPWSLVLATPSEQAFQAVDDLLSLIGAVTLVFLVVAIVMTGFLAHQITAPVRRLHRAARRVTDGEYGSQVRATGNDELAELAAAFNAMSAKMHEDRLRLLRHQEELERTVEERTAALLEKNAELEMFVYAVSHDLKTPLVSLDWLTEDLGEHLREAQKEGDALETLRRMRANVDSMGALVDDLLDLSRIGKTEEPARPVDMEQALDEVIAELEPQRQERGVQVQREPGPAVTVRADPSHVHRLLSNLVGNAIKYSADVGGFVRLTPATDRIHGRDAWRLEVADNGPGIPVAMREQVFHPFVRIPETRARRISGTGIGLAIVRKIARTYGGHIDIADAPEGGASFRVWLPMGTDRTAVAEAAP